MNFRFKCSICNTVIVVCLTTIPDDKLLALFKLKTYTDKNLNIT